jgi:hypothetical protein
MAANAGVQFRGIPNVVKAYSSMKIPAWGIFCGSELLECYEGDNLDQGKAFLEEYLDRLLEGQSIAQYSLKVYDDLPTDGKIRPKTEATKGFRFSLQEERVTGSSSTQLILERLEQMEARIAVHEDDRDDEKRVGGMGDFLSGLMENQEIKNVISAGIARVLELIINPLIKMQSNPINQPASIGNISQPDPAQLEKIQNAIAELWNIDPHLGDNLAKLAAYAKKDPGKYRGLVQMLNLM